MVRFIADRITHFKEEIMKDRITQYPHRYQLVPVSGQSDTYDIIAKPGTVTEPGTPLNKANYYQTLQPTYTV